MSKNLLKYPYRWEYYSHGDEENTFFTDLGDGRIKINGTPAISECGVKLLIENSNIPSGSYIYSLELLEGEIIQNNNDSLNPPIEFSLFITNSTNSNIPCIIGVQSDTSYVEDTISFDSINEIDLSITYGYTFNNCIVAPMIRDDSIEDTTWVTYDGSTNNNSGSGSNSEVEPEVNEVKKIIVTSDITLDLRKTNIQSIKAKQYDDKSRYIKIDVVDNGEHIDLNGFDVNYKMLTSDDRALYDSCIIDEDGCAYIELTDNILYKGGKANCELVITGDENIISTMPFILQITPSVFQDDKIIAPDSFSVMNKIAELERTKADKTEIPTKVSELENDAEYITLEDIDIEVDPILETGVEIAQISVNGETAVLYAPQGGGGGGTDDYSLLSNKPQINGVVLSGNKTSEQLGLVAAETGKGLSSNDYTNTEKNKLNSIESGAEANVQSDWNETDSTSDAYIKNKPNIDLSIYATKEELSDYVTEDELGGIDTDVNDLMSEVFGDKRNIIQYPYTQDSATANGITLKDNGDGSIVVSGQQTSVSGTSVSLRTGDFIIPAGEYIFSCENVNPTGQGSEYIYAAVYLYLTNNDSVKKRVLGLTSPVEYKDGHPYYDDNLRLSSTSILSFDVDTSVYVEFEISPSTDRQGYNWGNQLFQFMIRDANEKSIKWFPPGVQSGLSDKVNGKEQLHDLTTTTLLSTNWVTSGDTHKYSLESLYPANTYSIEQMQPINSLASLEAWGKAKILGNNDNSENYIIAYGDKPTSNIDVMFYVKREV